MREISIDECNWVSGGIENVGGGSGSNADGTGESGAQVGSNVATEAAFDTGTFSSLVQGAVALIGAGVVIYRTLK